MNTRIIVFAKAPVAGRAKTRLAGVLGTEATARLAQHMLNSTLHACLTANIGPVELCMSPDFDDPKWADISLPPTLILSNQGEGDLGYRMAYAARRALSDNARVGHKAQQQVLLVGTDCPQLSSTLLRDATHRLSSQDALLHPTEDGGYALLGLRKFRDSLFNNIPWSTHTVAALTQKRLSQLGWRYRVAERLRDIDEPADLFWLTPSWRQVLTLHKASQEIADV
ncbi:TIGR04282 family arsenosugar biosynthesis glycosyltransferase [Oceanisphaera pacifica]|uniref:TIGR04282 family arsenosugar biosynthesis glycosyltransferase n=1 Tax=Oceanisphaera pacifica TaxID=2818389 RepID=A0ABS3NDQ7_9GAMM|nr:TIGR04282 family arsenosugar biosynthesis glycosyltransferase [Oceanisphaera pacifica]MBO1518726.1 TIGR04282 family arsenosugar biosynthesis glycosyltransferase [Oceanisphaera pacifica]